MYRYYTSRIEETKETMGWFGAAQFEEFAKHLARDFTRHWVGGPIRDPLPPKKIQGALNELRMSVLRYCELNTLGFFGKTRLANALKWALQDLGVSSTEADMVVREALLAISLAHRRQQADENKRT